MPVQQTYDRPQGSRSTCQNTQSASGNPLLGLQARPTLCPVRMAPGRRDRLGISIPHPSQAGCGSCLLASGSAPGPCFLQFSIQVCGGHGVLLFLDPECSQHCKSPNLPHVQNRHRESLSLGRESQGSGVRARTGAMRPLTPSTDLSLPYLWVFLQLPQGETRCGVP